MSPLKNKSEKITFITSSLGTKWESYSQALLKIHFPECRRIVVDGTRFWNPLYFMDYANEISTDYLVLVDEDCFIFDRDQLLDLVDYLDKNEECALVATPDGGTYHRDYNPVACNTFFSIIRRKALLIVAEDEQWTERKYTDVINKITNNQREHLKRLDLGRANYNKSEPYYPFFWSLIFHNYTIRYLIPSLNTNLLASEIIINGAERPMLIHMWWLRSCNSKVIEPYLKATNYDRFACLEKYYLKYHFKNPSSYWILLNQNTIRNSKSLYRKLIVRFLPSYASKA